MHCLRAVIFACLFYFTDRVEGAASVISDAFTKESGEEVMPQTGWGRELNLHSIPHVSLTDASGTPVCAGILVSPEFVLTTASCVDGAVTGFDPSHSVADIGIRVNDIDSKTTGSGSRVATGKSEVEAGFEESKVGIAAVVVHEKYRSSEVNEPRHDVAFVELERPSNVQPALLLPEGTTDCVNGHFSTISSLSETLGRIFLAPAASKRLFLDSLAEYAGHNEKNEIGDAESFHLTYNTQKRSVDLGSGIFCLQGPKKRPVLVGLAAGTNPSHNSIDPTLFASISTYLSWILKNEYVKKTLPADLSVYERNDNDAEDRIIGAVDARPGQFPYAVSVRPRRFMHECDGALIGPRHVLTTASCVKPAIHNARWLRAFIGDIHLYEDRSPEAEQIFGKRIFLHPDEDKGTDLAIIILEKASKEKPIQLPRENSDCYSDKKNMTVYGWGPQSRGSQCSKILQTGTVLYYSHDNCEQEYSPDFFTPVEVCGFNEFLGTALCSRDDGTGLVCIGETEDPSDDVLIGIAGNTGSNPDCTKLPSRFVDVKSAIDWIEKVLEV